MTDPQQQEWDREDLRAAIVRLGKARRAYEATKENVRSLEQQLRRAKSALTESHLRLVSAELALGRLCDLDE